MSVLYYVVRACSLLYSTIDRKQKDFLLKVETVWRNQPTEKMFFMQYDQEASFDCLYFTLDFHDLTFLEGLQTVKAMNYLTRGNYLMLQISWDCEARPSKQTMEKLLSEIV